MKNKGLIVMILVFFLFVGHVGAEEKPALVIGVKEGSSIKLTNHSPITRTYVLYQLDHEQFSGPTRLCAGEIKPTQTKTVRDPCKPGKYMLMMHPGIFQAGKSYRKFFKVTASKDVIVNFKEGEENEKNFSEMNI